MVLTNLCLFSIILYQIKEKKRKETKGDRNPDPVPPFFKEYQTQEAGTVTLLWTKQGQDFTLSALENRMKVKMLTYTTFSIQFQEVHECSTNSRTLG